VPNTVVVLNSDSTVPRARTRKETRIALVPGRAAGSGLG
jgi:hypothetical protein